MMSENLLQIKPISEMPLVRRDAPEPMGPEAPSAALISLGCAKNTVDSEIMLAALAGAGYRLVSEAQDAQVAIVNTCGFIEDAKRESIDTILEIAQLKEAGDLETLVVAGCLAERYRGELAQGLPEVDLFIGTREYDQLPALLGGARGGAREAFSDTLMDYGRRLPRILAEPGPSAYLKVAEGCSRPCTFCVIPRFRGRFRSRPLDLLVEEASALACAGVREVNLLAQEITSYGVDLGLGFSLARLLEELNDVEGLEWIRVLYNYPRGVTEELLDAYRELPKVCEYIDMPLQHVATPVLAAMRRGIDEEGTRELVSRIKKENPRLRAQDHHAGRLSRRDGCGFRASARLRGRNALRPAGRFRLLARGSLHRGATARSGAGGTRARAHGAAAGAARAHHGRGQPSPHRPTDAGARRGPDGRGSSARAHAAAGPGSRRRGILA